MSGIFLRNATIVAITFIGCVGAAESRVLLGQQLDERQKLLAAIYDHSNTGQNLTQMNPGKDFSVVVGDRHSFIPLHPKKKPLACASDAVLVGTVQKKQAFLTGSQRFIVTEYELDVEDTMKDNPKSAVKKGDVLSILRPGGEVISGGRRILAIDESLPPLEEGGQYLLFLQFREKAATYTATSRDVAVYGPEETTFRLKDGKIAANGRTAWGFIKEVKRSVRACGGEGLDEK